MTSIGRGKRISDVEVTNVSAHGFWVLMASRRELFVSFKNLYTSDSESP